MYDIIILGGGLAFAAALQPGPLQAFLLARTAVAGWRRTLPAALSPLLSDGITAVVVMLAIGALPAAVQQLLRAAGGIVLIYLGWSSFRATLSPSSGSPPGGASSAPQTLLQATIVNVLNPAPYLAWALVIGPTVVAAWRVAPARAFAFLAAFYGTMVGTLAGLVVLFGATGGLDAGTRRRLVRLSALLLAAVGVYQLVAGLAPFDWRSIRR
jgi:threonine/homoserine/homoserine lactone efflux protein